MSAIAAQPQAGEKGQQLRMMTPPKPAFVVPAGLPSGLAYLDTTGEVRVHQYQKRPFGRQTINIYTICNSADHQIMRAKEDTDTESFTTEVCGTDRPFVINITDNQGVNLIQLHRPLRCRGCWCWCCYLQEMEIYSPARVPIATIKEVWTCLDPKYRIYDINETPLFTILGKACYCTCGAGIILKIFRGDDETEECGQIIKHTDVENETKNNFTLQFSPGLDVFSKVILLGATFLVDFNYFEDDKTR